MRSARFWKVFYPAGIRFNAVLFGSTFVKMWPALREYDATNEQEALTWLRQHECANMGGTEMLATIQDVYSQLPAEG